MKNSKFYRNYALLIIAIFFITSQMVAQNVKTIKTWYDSYTQTKLHEIYTVLNTPPYLKHGNYKSYNENTILVLDENYSNGVLNGLHREYYDEFPIEGKLVYEMTYKNGQLNGWKITYEYWVNTTMYKNIQRIKKEFYKDDVLIKTIILEPDGKTIIEETSN